MKKALLIVVTVVGFSASTYGLTTSSIGVSYMGGSVTYNVGSLGISSIGLTYEYFAGDSIGFVMNFNFGYPLKLTAAGTSYSISGGGFNIALDYLLGIGFRTSAGPNAFVIGAGPILNAYYLTSSSLFAMGVGVGGILEYDVGINDQTSFYIKCGVSYAFKDLFESLTAGYFTMKSYLDVTPGIGVAFHL